MAPDPVENCTVINKSSESFHLQCTPGFDGGMEQVYVVAVTDRNTNHVVYNATIDGVNEPLTPNKNPLSDVFIQNLSAGSSYLASITPVNKKGVGQTSHVLVDTLSHPAVELTQAEDAASAVDPSDAVSGNDNLLNFNVDNKEDMVVVVTGIITGGFICVLVLAIASLLIRRYVRKKPRRRPEMNARADSPNMRLCDEQLPPPPPPSASMEPMVKDGNVVIVQPRHPGGGVVRKGILKHSNTLSHSKPDVVSANGAPTWNNYEMSAKNGLQSRDAGFDGIIPPPPLEDQGRHLHTLKSGLFTCFESKILTENAFS